MTLYPFATPTIDNPIPVFPEVGSMMVSPGFSNPSCSAFSIILRAIRSFTLPPGLKNSSFTNTSAESSGTILFNLTIGVLPINSVTEL